MSQSPTYYCHHKHSVHNIYKKAFGFQTDGVGNMWSCHLLIAAVVSILTKDGSVKFTQDN